MMTSSVASSRAGPRARATAAVAAIQAARRAVATSAAAAGFPAAALPIASDSTTSIMSRRLLVLGALSLVPSAIAAQGSFSVDETSISAVHAAMRARTLTCHALVKAYLDRIDAYDKKGPSINAITVVN